MSIGYTPFPDGARLDTVRNTLNTFNGDAATNINNLLAEVTSLDYRISDNSSDIVDLGTRVTALEAVAPYYYYTHYTNVTVPSDSYSAVAELHRTDIDVSGTYEIKFSANYTLDSVTHSAYVRFSLDNGATWFEYRREPKDKTDTEAINYSLPHVFTSTSADILVEARKESSGDNMEFSYFDVILERKK